MTTNGGIEEDEVCYWIIDDGEEADGELLSRLLDVALDLSRSHIWNRETFNLKRSSGRCFTGRTKFGSDGYSDEWLIIALLLQLTERFPAIVASVADMDGDPIVIESADVLPDWLDAHCSPTNRVFLYQGAVHLIPDDRDFPQHIATRVSGASLVRAHHSRTLSTPLTRAIRRRCDPFLTTRASESLLTHRCTMRLPADLGLVARYRPDLVACAVSKLHEISPARLQKTAAGCPPLDSLVSIPGVTFSRVHFLALLTSPLIPDRRSPFFQCVDSTSLLSYRLLCALGICREEREPGNCDFDDIAQVEEKMDELKSADLRMRFSDGDNWHFSDALLTQLRLLPSDCEHLALQLPAIRDDDKDWLNVSSKDLDATNFIEDTRCMFEKSFEQFETTLGHDVEHFLTERTGDYLGASSHRIRTRECSGEQRGNGKVEMEFETFGGSLARILALEKQQSGGTSGDFGSDSDSSSVSYGKETNSFNFYMEAMDRELRRKMEKRKTLEREQHVSSGIHDKPKSRTESAIAGEMLASAWKKGGTGPASALIAGARIARLAEPDSDSD